MRERAVVTAYLAAACQRGGPAAWAAALVWGEHVRVVGGLLPAATPARAAVAAALGAVRALRRPALVRMRTPSPYALATARLLPALVLRGWTRFDRRRGATVGVAHADLWQSLLAATRDSGHMLDWAEGAHPRAAAAARALLADARSEAAGFPVLGGPGWGADCETRPPSASS
jgi:ribonuclease HI